MSFCQNINVKWGIIPKKKNEEYDGSEEENLDSSAFDALIYEITQEFKISDLEISDSDKTD